MIALTRNWRGVSTPDLVCELQHIKDNIEEFSLKGLDWYEAEVDSIQKELERRHTMTHTGVTTTNKDIIEAIKAKVDIVDIIGRYTDVICRGRKFYFRCKIHGDDKEPSGVIHPEDQTWHCFGCNLHGDVFDFIGLWERVSFPKALFILGKLLGINTSITDNKKHILNHQHISLKHQHTVNSRLRFSNPPIVPPSLSNRAKKIGGF